MKTRHVKVKSLKPFRHAVSHRLCSGFTAIFKNNPIVFYFNNHFYISVFLGRLKYILPQHIKIMIYNSLILSHLNYGILPYKKQSIRRITCAKYNSHTEPLFKNLKLLKLSEIFSIAQLKFHFRYKYYKLPE